MIRAGSTSSNPGNILPGSVLAKEEPTAEETFVVEFEEEAEPEDDGDDPMTTCWVCGEKMPKSGLGMHNKQVGWDVRKDDRLHSS